MLILKALSTFFDIPKHKSSIKKELLAGCATFLSMAYIISLQPQIMSQSGLPFSACVTATILVCFFSSLAMGLYANNPIVLGPGLSLSGFWTYTLVQGQGVPYQTALGATFLTGVFFIILSLFKVREKLTLAIPSTLKHALVCGIGLFVAFIGLKEGDFFNPSDTGGLKAPVLTLKNMVFLICLTLTCLLLALKIKGAFLISILVGTLLCLPIGRLLGETPLITWKGVLAPPDFSSFALMDVVSALKFSALPVLLSLIFVDMFESMSSIWGIARSGPLLSQSGQKPRHLKKSLLVDAFATTSAGLIGSSPAICFLESLVGIHAGGRTGLTALTAGVLFLPFLFLSPLVSMIPEVATAPILVVLGSYMMKSASHIEWDKPSEALPAFIMILLIPLCFSIIQGIIYGFLFYTTLKVLARKGRTLSPYMYVLTAFCLLFLVLSKPFTG